MKKIIFLFIALLTTVVTWSQQDAQYTQYMYNMSVINPAYTTGEVGVINIGGLHRNQWVGVIGSPKTSTLFVHAPINEKIEVGISFVNDNVGDVVKENNIFADFAYKIDFENNRRLSFGLKAGVTFFDVDFFGFELESGNVFTDPNFAENIHEAYFNMGAGVYYNTDKFYIGLSIPNFLNAKHLERDNGKYQGTEQAHFFLTGGYVFDLSETIKLKPAFMAKTAKGAPISLDLTANVLFNDRIEFGIGYRLEDAVIGMVNFKVTPQLRIGYAYDYTTSNLSTFSSGSHEVFVLYDLDILNLNKGFDKSPRFF